MSYASHWRGTNIMAALTWSTLTTSICMKRIVYLFVSLSLMLCTPERCVGSKVEEKLLRNLTMHYRKSVRPVMNDTYPLKVFVGLSISQIIDVDERNQVMTTSLWVKQRWIDYRLAWNPLEFGNVTVIHIPINNLWKPDLVLYNNIDGPYDVRKSTMALVHYNGTVYWLPPAVYKSACKIDIQYFPFDEQKCVLKFGSWTYDASKIDLEAISSRIDRELYWPNQEWDIMDTPIEKHTIKYPCCDDMYVDLTFAFVLHRKSLFYIVTFVIPCVLITFLTIFVFYLPTESGEKVTLCISILLALIVFLLLIAESIPTTSTSIPMIGCYLLFTMGMVSISTVVTVVIINIFHRGADTHTMPLWVKTIFIDSNIAKYLWIARPADYLSYNITCDEEEHMKKANDLANCNQICMTTHSCTDSPALDRSCFNRNAFGTSGGRGVNNLNYRPLHLGANQEPSRLGLNPSLDEGMEWRESETGEDIDHDPCMDGESKGLPARLREGLSYIEFIVDRTRDSDKDKRVEEDWSYVSMIIDRIFLYIYMLAVTIGTTSILLSSPVLWESEDFHPPQPVEKAIIITRPPTTTTPPTGHA